MTDFEKTYQNYNPRAAALSEARALLTAAAKAAMMTVPKLFTKPCTIRMPRFITDC